MLEFPSLTIDYTQQESPSSILPQAPLIASNNANWRGITLSCYNHAEHETPLHSLTQHGLVITLSAAKLEFKLGKSLQSKNLIDGNIQLIPAHVPYYAAWNQSIRFMVIALEPIYLSKIANQWNTNSSVELIPQFLNSDPLIYGVGQALRSELICGSNNTLYIDSLLNCLSTHLLHRYTNHRKDSQYNKCNTKGLSQRQLNTIVDYIHAHLDRNLSLAELSKQIHLSSDYLTRLFKQTTGLTLHRYVMQCRIDRAKHLLKHSYLSIGEISLEVGFANQQHFTRQFRQLTGNTPSVFRKMTF